MNLKFEYVEWPYLRSALVMFTGFAALGASLLAGSATFESRMQRDYLYHSDRLTEIRRRYLAVDEEEKVIRDYLPRFMELDKNGLSGEERRLNWVETLQDAGDALRLPSLGYEIKAQKPYRPGAAPPPGRYRVFASEMTLSMLMLHEGDLFALLDLLDERAQGVYTVSSCDMTRNFVELADNPDAGNIAADCLLEWFTVKPEHDRETGA